MKTNLLSVLVAITLLAMLFSCSKKEEPKEEVKPNKDIILVLDTSLSMIGKGAGAKNIMPQVKDKLKSFIDNVVVGDTLTFITFDSEVKRYPTIRVQDDNDKDIIKSYLSIVEARGQWTFTMEMFRNVLQKADEINKVNKAESLNAQKAEKEYVERKQAIVILTDALDDPPPADKSKKLDIKDLATEYSGVDWFMYFVSLSADNAKLQALRDELNQGLDATTEVIDAGSNIEGSIDGVEDSVEQIETKRRSGRPVYKAAWFYLVLIFLVILIIGIIYAIHAAKIKLTGLLEYRNKVVLGSTFQKVNLERYDARRITVGKDSLCEVRIADFESNTPICVESAMVKGELFVFINTDRGIKVVISEGKGEPFLADGTLFEAGGYEFRFSTRKS